MTDALDHIDATLEGLCACGCRVEITDASPSAWYASEACYDHHHGRADRIAAEQERWSAAWAEV